MPEAKRVGHYKTTARNLFYSTRKCTKRHVHGLGVSGFPIIEAMGFTECILVDKSLRNAVAAIFLLRPVLGGQGSAVSRRRHSDVRDVVLESTKRASGGAENNSDGCNSGWQTLHPGACSEMALAPMPTTRFAMAYRRPARATNIRAAL